MNSLTPLEGNPEQRTQENSSIPSPKKGNWKFQILAEWEELLADYGQDHYSSSD